MSHTYGMLLFVAYGIQASSHFAVPTAQLYGLTDNDEHRYEAFIGPVNQILKELKHDVRHMRKMNPRKRRKS